MTCWSRRARHIRNRLNAYENVSKYHACNFDRNRIVEQRDVAPSWANSRMAQSSMMQIGDPYVVAIRELWPRNFGRQNWQANAIKELISQWYTPSWQYLLTQKKRRKKNSEMVRNKCHNQTRWSGHPITTEQNNFTLSSLPYAPWYGTQAAQHPDHKGPKVGWQIFHQWFLTGPFNKTLKISEPKTNLT